VKKVSVIILNWNGTHLLRKYLPSVVEYTTLEVADVVVADNGSTDESLHVVEAEFPTVKTIPLAQNYGFAEGYNRAIAAVDTPYVILLNDDVAVSPGWLEPLLDFMETHPECGACQPKLLSDRDRTKFEYAGAAGGYLDSLGYPFCRGRIFATTEIDRGQYDTPAEIHWASGACLMIRRDLYREAGGLDARFFAHMEEIDLCWRIRRMGYSIYCRPDSVVYHFGGASLAMGDPRKTKLNFRNSLLMLWKNLPRHRRQGLIFRRMLLDGVAALNFLLRGEWNQVKAIRQAHREYKDMRDKYYQSDDSAEKGVAELCDFSILFKYYIQRKIKFSELNL